jgi:hypothetical protein
MSLDARSGVACRPKLAEQGGSRAGERRVAEREGDKKARHDNPRRFKHLPNNPLSGNHLDLFAESHPATTSCADLRPLRP